MTEQCKLCGAWVHNPCRSESQMATCEWGGSSIRSEVDKMAHHAAAYGWGDGEPDEKLTLPEWREFLQHVERFHKSAPHNIPKDEGKVWFEWWQCWLVEAGEMARLLGESARLKRAQLMLGWHGGAARLYEEITGSPPPSGWDRAEEVQRLRDELSETKREITDLEDERDSWELRAKRAENRPAIPPAVGGLAVVARRKKAARWSATLGVWFVQEERMRELLGALDSVDDLEEELEVCRADREALTKQVHELHTSPTRERELENRLEASRERLLRWEATKALVGTAGSSSKSWMAWSEDLGCWLASRERIEGMDGLKGEVAALKDKVGSWLRAGQAVWSTELGTYVVTAGRGSHPVAEPESGES